MLGRTTTVFLSTDAFHQEAVADTTYVNAARAVARAGAWIVVQVIGVEPMVAKADTLLRAAFGDGYESFAELRETPALTAGRSASVFRRTGQTAGHAFAPCTLVASPIVRYDGLATACCNESVVMGYGPERLRRRVGSRAELASAMAGFRADPLLRAIGGAGPRVLTAHPRYADLADEEFRLICDLCWKLLGRDGRSRGRIGSSDAMNTLLVAR